MSVQYRVVFAKNDEAVDGPDDADVVVTIGVADAGLAPATAFMLGKLKNTGPTGALFAAFRDGRRGSGDQPARIASLSAR
jgi:hypothetical protein